MNQAVYDTISGFDLLDNYKVHYYFDSYAGGASNAHVYSDADSQYSGKIFSYEDGAHSAAALDYFTGDLGTGTFSGGLNGFYDYVSIENYGDLFSGEFTFLINAQTTSRQDLGENEKGPVSNNNILFSNLESGEVVSQDITGGLCTGTRYSGWQIGINASNRAYIEVYNNFEPLMLTYMGTQNPYSHNIWGAVYIDGAVKMGLYDISAETFSFNHSSVEATSMETASLWRIGSGANFDLNAKFSPELTLNSGLFAGKMNNFLYFNTGLSDNEINTLAKSLYSDIYAQTPDTYTSGDTVFLHDGLSGLTGSGVIGTVTECSETGTLTGTVTSTCSGIMTGDISVGEIYYLVDFTGAHPICGTYTGYRALYNTGFPETGITGFSGIDREIETVTSLTGCSGVDVSGLLVSGAGVSPSGEGGFTGLLASGISGLSGDIPAFLRPDAFSYIGTPLAYEGVIEKYNVGAFGSVEQGSLNNLAILGEATLADGQGFFMTKTGNSASLAFYLNGVGREEGDLSVRETSISEVFTEEGVTYALTECGAIITFDTATDFEIETFFNNYNIISGDYYISGLEILDSLRFPYAQEDILQIYDTGLNTGYMRSRWLVTGTTDYETPPSPVPISGDQWVFFNGQKLISGVNYIDDASAGFTPSGYITGITGLYFTTPLVAGTTQTTGSALSFEGGTFFPNSNVIFINGVRQDVSTSYVEHSNTKDLISGKETLTTYGASVYNN